MKNIISCLRISGYLTFIFYDSAASLSSTSTTLNPSFYSSSSPIVNVHVNADAISISKSSFPSPFPTFQASFFHQSFSPSSSPMVNVDVNSDVIGISASSSPSPFPTSQVPIFYTMKSLLTTAINTPKIGSLFMQHGSVPITTTSTTKLAYSHSLRSEG